VSGRSKPPFAGLEFLTKQRDQEISLCILKNNGWWETCMKGKRQSEDPKKTVLDTLTGLHKVMQETYKVRRIGLFGSWARGEQRPDSDIDLLVDFSGDTDLFDFAELKYFLEDQLHHRVDIVPARALRDELKQAVLADVSYVLGMSGSTSPI